MTVQETTILPYPISHNAHFVNTKVNANWQTHGSRAQTLSLIFFLTVFVAVFSGCINTVKTEADPEQLAVATEFIDAGDYNAAAEKFLSIAETFPDQTASEPDNQPSDQPSEKPTHQPRQAYQLSAAETYIKGGEANKARQVLSNLQRTSLLTPLLIRYDIASARVAELDEQPAEVIKALEDTPVNFITDQLNQPTDDEEDINPEVLQARNDAYQQNMRDILSLRINAFDELEAGDQATLSRVQIDPFLIDEAQLENRKTIWQSLQSMETDDRSQLRADSTDQALAGWLDLIVIVKQDLHNAEKFDASISSWRHNYPDHSAETPVLAELYDRSSQLGKKITSIALLLPNNGRFAKAAAAVRDGFLASWYDDNNNPDQPRVKVYNANNENILQVYERVIEEGAEIIVGPLDKETLQTLLSLPELPVTTLALNQLNDQENEESSHHIMTDRLYQFGLSPEWEAAQVADRAWAEGYTNALAITPETDWGDRLFGAFVERFEMLGGKVLEHQSFATAHNDYSTPVTQLLNINGSIERFNALTKQLNRKIKFEPRSRRDMDFIFVAASPVQARQIRPQLLYHRVSQTPVLATSHAFGVPTRDEPDLDMEGMVIGDMPWLLNARITDPDTPLSMQNNWPDNNTSFLRLYVLGMDAYTVIPHLGRMRLMAEEEFKGKSGVLTMNKHAQIQRQLSWAKFVQGKPQLLKPLDAQPIRQMDESNF